MRAPLLETCETRYVLADGGISTILRRMTGTADAVAEALNLDDPSVVLEMHRQFANAGADCLTTNSFGANAMRISGASIEHCVRLCTEAARLARQAAGPDKYVIGSVGPWYATDADWKGAFGHQVRALADGGVDAIMIETVGSLEAGRELVKCATGHDSHLPVMLCFTFNKTAADKFVLVGDEAPLEQVAESLAGLGAQAYGINCGKGMDAFDYATLISQFRQGTDKCILARPSAGDPREETAGFLKYPDSPEYMTEAVWGMVRAGANIIGGCCGVTAEHIAAFRVELDMLG